MSFTRISGIGLIVAGVALGVAGFLGFQPRAILLIVGVVLIFSGVINLFIWNLFGKFTKNMPKQSFSGAMSDARQKMESMEAMADNKERVGRLRSEGMSGKATILSFTDTGQKVAGDPVYSYELSVELPLYPVYTVTHQQFTPQLMLAQITPGKIFDVKVDKEDQQNLNIEWI